MDTHPPLQTRRSDLLQRHHPRTTTASSSSSPPSKKQMHACPALSANNSSPSSSPSPSPNPRFSIGLALHQTDLGDTTSSHHHHQHHNHHHHLEQPFVRAIMHKVVSPRCFEARVLLDAPPHTLATAFGVSTHLVTDVWLAGLHYHLQHPSNSTSSSSSSTSSTSSSSLQQTPPPTYHPPTQTHTQIQQQQQKQQKQSNQQNDHLPGMLDRRQFGALFARERPPPDPQVSELAQTLITKLSALPGQSSPDSVHPQTRPRISATMTRETVPNSGTASSAGMVDSSGCSSAGEAARTCGFSDRGTHVDLQVLCDGLAITKTGSGLYRTARTASKLHVDSNGVRHLYFEVVIVEDCDAGGICVGVSTNELPLNKLIGSNGSSIGLHSSGQIVSRGGEFRSFARGFGKGDRVGCRVTLGGGDMCDGETDRSIELRFWINGEWQGCVRERLGDRFATGEAELYAAVSLYRKASKAVIQCCQKDWAIDMDAVSDGGHVEAVCSQKRL